MLWSSRLERFIAPLEKYIHVAGDLRSLENIEEFANSPRRKFLAWIPHIKPGEVKTLFNLDVVRIFITLVFIDLEEDGLAIEF